MYFNESPLKKMKNAFYFILRPCDTDIYFRNIIFSNISEIIFMCITDYFKLLSCSCAIKTLNLKFLTESKVKKKFVQFNTGKKIDELEIAYQLVHL